MDGHAPAYVERFGLSRPERIADGIVHAAGIAFAVAAGALLLVLAAFHAAPLEYAAAVFYAASLVLVLSVSCAYNMWPLTRPKALLRRFDHAAIFLLIAGTYAPFLAQVEDPATANGMTAAIWIAAGFGIAVKLALPGRFDRLAIVLYLALGWSGLAILHTLSHTLPAATLWLIAAGGIAYSAGVVFHVWTRLRFQNALWHLFVLAGAALHYGAVMDSLVIARG